MEPDSAYHHYYMRSLPDGSESKELEAWSRSGTKIPPIHIVVEDQADADLGATLASVSQQTYPSLGCTVLTTPDRVDDVHAMVIALALKGPRRSWSVVAEPAQAIPSRRSSTRLVGFLRAGERLAPAALLRFARARGASAAGVIYSDHDTVERTGHHVDPWFVGDWAPDHLLSQDYVGGFFLARDTARFREIGPALLSSGHEGWRYQLLLSLTDDAVDVEHVASVLWSGSAAARDDTVRAARDLETVAAALRRRGVDAVVETVSDGRNGPVRNVTWPLAETPLVSVVIPTTGRIDLVAETLDSLLKRTDYPAMEIIFIDNSRGRHPDGVELLHQSAVTVLERDEDFNWAKLNNDGAAIAKGDMLLFLNDDMEVSHPEWLTELVRQARRDEVGAVGSLLLYPDGMIQHAGVFIVGHGGGAVHMFHRMDPEDEIYLGLQRVAREMTAVTGACLLVRRSAFMEIDGFDEALAVVGNDVDLCLRLTRTGHRTVWTPRSTLIHHESVSRSAIDHLPDEDRMWQRWSDVLLSGDPHYNPNLAQDRVDAALDWESVAERHDPVMEIDPATGVNLVGYIRAEMGIGEAARGEAQGLTDADVPFVIIDHQQGNPARMEDASWVHKVVEEPVFDTNILHLNADVLPTALLQLPTRLRTGRRNIGYWTWELPVFPRRWHAAFELVDEVWVPSEFVREAIGAGAPVPVRVVPHVIRAPVGLSFDRAAFGLPKDTFQFLSMYDTQSVQERKNPHGTVEAFTRAFEPDDTSVALALKVNTAGDRELNDLRRLAAQRSNLYLITNVLSRAEMDSLMASSDAFISLHRSEGFGLAIAEAMALGKPVIATGWSGNMDFMTPGTAAAVRYEIVELEQSFGPYEAGQRWAEPDVDDAAAWMRRFRDEPAAARRMGAGAAEAISRTNSPAIIGRLMAGYLANRPEH
jgi:GT2 family glycosyltransferase